ncbi:hypothetical protein [Pandoraea sp. CB10b_02]|uniref:hypothetical protein n=1 Tax=Pandoraea sp. CB10b_02 TaxID=2014535 RepID=UPI00257CF173|nr:hypothetical protein [Pandoraea sp. CB10b_02]
MWVSTAAAQHFYRNEFDLAHVRDPKLAQTRSHAEAMLVPTRVSDVSVENACRDISRWLETVTATGERGWRFRAARDTISLVGNLSLLVIIAASLYRESAACAGGAGHDAASRTRGAASVNTPFDVPWADWLLLGLEGLKGVVTQSLGSPTLIRHHAADEILKRMEAACRLLEACVAIPQTTPSSWRNRLGALARSRDVATLFTLSNTAVPPARLALWLPSWFRGPSAAMDGYRGYLRVAGLMLDSFRAMTSLVGTWARNAAFADDAHGLAQRLQALNERLALVPCGDEARVLARVTRVKDLAAHCDTALLAEIASRAALCERLLTSREPLQAGEIARVCESFDVTAYPVCVDARTRLSLSPAESPWGRRWTEDGWRNRPATPVRATYRLLLSYQHWSSALLERLLTPSQCTEAAGRAEGRAVPGGAPRAGDPPGIARAPGGVVYVDIDSTRV